ncbi:MAG: DsbA family protein [Anaerolineales bacterium]|nr:DsbA family protein [Anaerolineales bacterium]MDW8325082.1 thioredoxin domain-containing protein [Anaerolineales bacterium]
MQFATGAGRRLKDEYINAGKSVRLEYYHFTVVDTIVGGNESRNAARAADCAAEQGRFWRYHDLLFANVQGEGVGSFRDARLRAMAEAAGLNLSEFNACYDSGRTAASVDADINRARTLGVTGTPTIFINGQRVSADYNAIKAHIDQLLASP